MLYAKLTPPPAATGPTLPPTRPRPLTDNWGTLVSRSSHPATQATQAGARTQGEEAPHVSGTVLTPYRIDFEILEDASSAGYPCNFCLTPTPAGQDAYRIPVGMVDVGNDLVLPEIALICAACAVAESPASPHSI